MKDKTDLQVAQFEEIDFTKSWASAKSDGAAEDEFFISSAGDILEPEQMAIIVASETDPDDLGLDPNMVPLEDPNKTLRENSEMSVNEPEPAEEEESIEEPESEEAVLAQDDDTLLFEDEGPAASEITYSSIEDNGTFSLTYESTGTEDAVLSDDELAEVIAKISELSENTMTFSMCEEAYEALEEAGSAEAYEALEEAGLAEASEELVPMNVQQLVNEQEQSEDVKHSETEQANAAELNTYENEQSADESASEETAGVEILSSREKKRLQREQKEQELLDEKLRREEEFRKQLLESEDEALKRLRKHRVASSILNAITMVSSAVFFICLLEISWYYIKSFQYQQDMNQLLDGMQGGIVGDILSDEPITQDNGDILIFPDEGDYVVMDSVNKFDKEVGDVWLSKYQYLSEMNPDCIGYIEIPNSPISLPVMFTPDDYDKYLYKNFSGEKETRGTPFLDAATKIGKSPNYIIYAHNMADDMAFGSLDKYLSKSYYKENKYIYFNTAVSEGVYEIMAVCKTKIFNKTDECFKYYKYGGVLTKDEFDTYVKEVKKISEYNTGVDAKWGDELITLSTCNKYTENGRLIVVAKRIK